MRPKIVDPSHDEVALFSVFIDMFMLRIKWSNRMIRLERVSEVF